MADGGEVNIDLDSNKRIITISDNGKGMSRKDLETVFVDLGASGKRDEAGASGGFGLAKAAPLMMSKKITVETVADVKGKRYRSTMTTNKNELLGEGAAIETVEVPKSTPTGTTVKTHMDTGDYWQWNDAKRFAINSAHKSIDSPGKVNVQFDGDPISDYDLKAHQIDPAARKQMSEIHHFSVPGADATIHASFGKKGLEHKMGSVFVEVNNNGIYQFDDSIYLGGGAAVEGVPSIISMNVKATVPEGHKDYPFTANREELRGDYLHKKLEEYITKQIIEPSVKKAQDFIAKKYSSLPTVGTDFNVAIFDSGARLTPEEMTALQNNKAFVNLSEEVAQVLDDSLYHIGEAGSLKDSALSGLGEGIERAGIVFSEKLHGVHITDPATKKATVFINPFTFDKASTPKKAASLVWHTIKHEILHDKVKGHNESFTSGLVRMDEALGDYDEAIGRLTAAYADPGDVTKFHPEIEEALRVYKDSRGRPERETDPFRGESSRRRSDGSGGSTGSADALPDNRKRDVRGSGPAQSGGKGLDAKPAVRSAAKPERKAGDKTRQPDWQRGRK